MPATGYLLIYIAFPLAFCVFANPVHAQHRPSIPDRQNGIVQKQPVADSFFQYKIDSRLLQVLARQKNKENTGTETEEPGDMDVDSNGNLPVDISAAITDSLLYTITKLGGKIIYPSKTYHTVRAVINLSVVKTIALRPDVTFVQPAGQAHNNGAVPRPGL